MKAKHVPNDNPNNVRVYFHCPGCNQLHAFNPYRWQFFNWDMENPTVRESILVTTGGSERCHSFITDGSIKFEHDTTHNLSGQTVLLPDLSEDDLSYFEN